MCANFYHAAEMHITIIIRKVRKISRYGKEKYNVPFNNNILHYS